MGLWRHVRADLVAMHLHGPGVGPWQHERCTLAVFWADGAEQVGVLVALVGRLTGPCSLPRPLPRPAILLAKPGFVLEPELNRSVGWQIGYVRCKRVGEVFLNALMILSSCLAWRGRALMWAKPSSARRSEIARSL